MKKITYYCPYSNRDFLGVLVKEEGDLYYIADPFLYLWLVKINRLDLLEKVTLRTYMKDSDFYYRPTEFDLDIFSEKVNKIFTFPIEEIDTASIHGIALFFEHLLRYERSSIEFTKKVELSLEAVEKVLERDVIRNILVFTIDHFSYEHKVKTVFSSPIASYLKGEST